MMCLNRRGFITATAAAFATGPAFAAAKKPYQIPDNHRARIVKIRGGFAPDEIHVDPKKFALYWTLPDDKAIRYPVAIGLPGQYYDGAFTIGRKAEWPSWTPTKRMVARNPEYFAKFAGGVPGGPENPLGSRALYLYDGPRDSLLRIHGTTQPWLVETETSSGCVRMINDHVEDLFVRVRKGTKVILH
jgi:lipoprotein-anchoring transpeptidase ErfK/SrfK